MKVYRSYKDLPPAPLADLYTDAVPIPKWRTFRPEFSKEKCTKCYLCWKFCPEVAISIDEEGYPQINLDFCKGCGICAFECRPECIIMVREE